MKVPWTKEVAVLRGQGERVGPLSGILELRTDVCSS